MQQAQDARAESSARELTKSLGRPLGHVALRHDWMDSRPPRGEDKRGVKYTLAPRPGWIGGRDLVSVWALPAQGLLSGLLPKSELTDDVTIPVGIVCLQVVEKTASRADQHQ